MPNADSHTARSIELPLAVSRVRCAAALLIGTLLFLLIVLGSNLLPAQVFGTVPGTSAYAWTGLLQAVLVPLALMLALRPVGGRLRDLGLVRRNIVTDVLIGAAIALAFALLQFLIIIPATGGAGRSDVTVNSAQIGESLAGVAAFLVLAWTGSFAEELFFRGHFLNLLERLLGDARWVTPLAVVITTSLFAALHGYQGWAGVIDTGLYGGLSLTLLYLWRGRRLAAGIVAHAGWNTLATIGIYLWY